MEESQDELEFDEFMELLKTGNAQVRADIAHDLAWHGVKAIPPLIQLVKAPEINVRLEAIQALGRIGSDQELPILFDILSNSTNKEIKLYAIHALGTIGDKQAFEPLVNILRNKDEWFNLRFASASNLGKLGDSRAFEPLNVALNDNSIPVRAGAVMGLGELGDNRAVEPLIERLSDPEEDVRQAAIFSLAKLGDKRAIPALEWVQQHDEASTDFYGKLKDSASKAITDIQSQN